MKIVGKWMTDQSTGRSFVAVGTDVESVFEASGIPHKIKDCHFATDAETCWSIYSLIKKY